MFNGFINHSVSSSCIKDIEKKSWVLKFYVVIATVGFMTLFGAGLVCYEVFRLFQEKKTISKQWKYFKVCCVLVFSGIIISFAGQAVSVYIMHCDTILYFYVTPLIVVFLLAIAIILWLNYTFNKKM